MVRSVRELAGRIIAEARAEPERLSDLALVLMPPIHAHCRRLEDEALVSGPRPACRKGCRWCCCGTRVDVLAPEALFLAHCLRAKCGESLEPRIRESARRVEALSAEDRHRQAIPCPLLDTATGSCSVHPVRPIACRGQSSFSARDCEYGLCHPAENRPISKHVALLMSQSAAGFGLRLSLSEMGLDARVLELTSALDVALSHRQAAERWARGEKLFGQAIPPACRQAGPVVSRIGAPPASAGSRNQRKAARRVRRG